jgi:hypothetical protein
MTGPGWLDGIFATLMMLIAACCASRLAIGRLRGRNTEFDADSLHVLMGVAMAGMFEPWLSPVPATVWRAVFAITAVWFSWRAIRARSLSRPLASRCAHPAPHAVECTAMVYMLLPTGTGLARQVPGRSMSGMADSASTTAGNPALALILALFLLGYILWTTDRLASLSRARAATPHPAGQGRLSLASPSRGTNAEHPPGPRGSLVGMPALAPRLAASYKIAMSVAMGYMLLTML